jgi:hypothetical protein
VIVHWHRDARLEAGSYRYCMYDVAAAGETR